MKNSKTKKIKLLSGGSRETRPKTKKSTIEFWPFDVFSESPCQNEYFCKFL